MHISFALLADAANLSQEGKLNVLGVFDALHVATLPTVHTRASLVLRFKGSRDDVGSHRLMLRWTNPAGEEVWSSEGELNVGQPPAGVSEMDLPLIAPLELPIDRIGDFALVISLDGAECARLRLQVRGGAQPHVAAPAAKGLVS